jgi:putative ABC transport system permease protein
MGWLRFFHRARWDDERAKELQDYLAREIDDNLARGMSEAEAVRAAHRRLGNTTLIREEIWEMNTLRLVETVWQDVRYGCRLLRRNPTFAAVAILTLALGTGANAAIFQLVNALRLRPLPVERPNELVEIDVDTHGKGHVGWGMNRRAIISEPLWRALSAGAEGFSSIFAFGVTTWNLATDGEYRPAPGLYVTGGFFDGLGVKAHIGRLISDADDRTPCASPGAVLSYGLWQSRYGGSADALGRTIALDGRAFPIIGVMPPGFSGVEVGRTVDIAVPLCAEPLIRGEMSGFAHAERWFLDPMGRLKAGWTFERARAQLAAISPAIFAANVPATYNAAYAKDYVAFTFVPKPAATGVSNLRKAYATELWVLLGATALVLLMTCANLANLMLARATAREREIAVRLAIGASRRRVIRHMLSESLLIAAAGAAGGALLARWLSAALVRFLSTETEPIFLDLTPDWRVFAFITLLAMAACLLFGLSPALTATGANPGRSMQAGGRSQTDSRERFALRRALVVVQVALSMVLVAGALLFARSLRNLAAVDPGLRTEGIVSVTVDLRRTAVKPEARAQMFDAIMMRVRGVAGVRDAAESQVVPMGDSWWNQRVVIDGALQQGLVYFNQVGGDYFRTLDVPLVGGRTFDARDRRGMPEVAIVNQAFARRYAGDAPPIGRTFQLEGPAPQPTYQIVGIVKNTKYNDVREETRPIVYLAAAQEAEPMAVLQAVVRSELPPASLTPSLTRAITDVAPGATVAYDTITRAMRDARVTERLMATLAGFFGLLALAIATVGLYGVMSYMVTRRRVEIGIRMALGADTRTVARLVLGESGLLLLIGLAIGVAPAVAAFRWARTLLFGLSPWDPASFLVAGATLAAVGLAAAWMPARRASRIEPSHALRE